MAEIAARILREEMVKILLSALVAVIIENFGYPLKWFLYGFFLPVHFRQQNGIGKK